MLAAQALALLVVAVSVVVLATNFRMLIAMEAYELPARPPRVSVLVPARDEERSVEDCLRSLLRQDYPDIEIIALDDDSGDSTLAIMERLAAEDGRLRVLRGEPLPEGWLGKTWACAQLAREATGDMLLFTDADTRHGRYAVAAGVAAALREEADLLTGLPHVETVTWGERLVLPAVPWSTITLVPLAFAYRVRMPAVSAANGQYMMFPRASYEALGGHETVRDEVVEDMALAKAVKAAGMTWRIGDASDIVTTRMYRNLREVFGGLGKNLFGVFGYGMLRYLVSWPLIALVFLLPAAVLAAAALGRPLPGASVPVAAATYAMAAGQFASAYRRFDYPPALALLYPLTVAILVLIAVWSLALTLVAGAQWKGRSLGRTRIRWL